MWLIGLSWFSDSLVAVLFFSGGLDLCFCFLLCCWCLFACWCSLLLLVCWLLMFACLKCFIVLSVVFFVFWECSCVQNG